MAKKAKFYVVWQGRTPGVYMTWDQCLAETQGFSGAKYKSFATRGLAEAAFQDAADDHWGQGGGGGGGDGGGKSVATPKIDRDQLESLGVDMTAWAVDAACKGNPGELEYQGVDLQSNTDMFHMGPYPEGTVNIGEFLAIVHALALLHGGGETSTAIYSDSRIGMTWVKKKKCNTKLPRSASNRRLFNLVDRAERWLIANTYGNPILKWETKRWGEIPADFGRK